MDISISAKQLQHSATLAMNERITQMRKKGEQIFHMGFGESPFPVHPLIRKALCDNSWRQNYLPTQGIIKLREQVSRFYETMFNLKYSPEQIIIGPGSKPLMFAALNSLDGPIFLPAPSWVSYQHMGRFSSRNVHYIETNQEKSYRLEADILSQVVQEYAPSRREQKVLIINSPCNPTSHVFTRQQLSKIAEVARENNMIVLSDEIYALTHYTDHEHHSIAEFYPEGTIVTGGLSKDRSLGGYRVGVLLIPPDEKPLLRSILALGSLIWSCVSAPIQYAAIEAYRTDTGLVEYMQDCRAIHEIVTKYAYKRIHAMGISCPAPEGAFYLFPDWNKQKQVLEAMSIKTSSDLASYLLEHFHVATLPGLEFGMHTENLCLRLASVDYDGEKTLQTFLNNKKDAMKHPDRFVANATPSVFEGCKQLELFMTEIKSKE